MTTAMPLVMALEDPAATVLAVGGKAASLARLARAGLPVPPGFYVTTRAYSDFVAGAGLREPLLDAVSGVDPGDPATFGIAATRIGELFAGPSVPAATATVIAGAYARLGAGTGVAVRSSATAEDGQSVSFAGQHATYLNVRGEDAVLSAVRRCWASLWTAEAIGYRARHGIAAAGAGMAVVVQRLVRADAAGVLFTVDPVSGDPGRVVVNANWGLGEAVAGGRATPDTAAVDRAGGHVIDYRVGGKEVMTVPGETGIREQPTPAGQREAAVLPDADTGRLARLGLTIEKLYGQPVDVEWARAGGELFILQARPVTSLAPAVAAVQGEGQAGGQWNDSLGGDYLWTNANLGEAIPDVMTPATWSFIELFMTRAISPPHVPGYYGYGRVGGRFYINLSMSAALAGVAGMSRKRFVRLTAPAYGRLPPGTEIPRVRLPRWKVFRMMVPRAISDLRRIRGSQKRLQAFVASAPDRCDRLRAGIGQIGEANELAAAWHDQVRPLFVEASDMLTAAGGGSAGVVLLVAQDRLTALAGAADAAVLLSGQQAGAAGLASLGPVTGLARLAKGEIDRAAFTRMYGHRGPHEIEVSMPRPAEEPGWIDEQLAQLGGPAPGVDELLSRQEAARQAAWQRLARQPPKKVAKAREIVTRWTAAVRTREAARSELVRSMWVLRAWVLRAGELTGHGDDLFFLSAPEILTVLGGDPAPLAAVPGRRATYGVYRALPPYPAVIRGRFDPVRWAADPGRRTDYYREGDARAPAGDTVTGFPGAAGVVEGVARVIGSAEDAGQLHDGEILVTALTNVGWTPVFPRAAAVVTDVGAPLSHAAIVARELGIPAVVGCGNATMRLHTGDRVRVDGGKGTAEVLRRA